MREQAIVSTHPDYVLPKPKKTQGNSVWVCHRRKLVFFSENKLCTPVDFQDPKLMMHYVQSRVKEGYLVG